MRTGKGKYVQKNPETMRKKQKKQRIRKKAENPKKQNITKLLQKRRGSEKFEIVTFCKKMCITEFFYTN